MPENFELENPDKLTFGAVGAVGQRLFVVQASKQGTIVTLKMEKSQVATLSQVVGRMLRTLPQPDTLPRPEEMELEGFDEPAFAVRTLRVGYDETDDRVVIICTEAFEEEEADDLLADDGASARFSVTRRQALALAIRGAELVEAGRPGCPRCGFPLDPRGHVCPKMNGNRPPLV